MHIKVERSLNLKANKKEQVNMIRSSSAEYLTYVVASGENGVELGYEENELD